jgi:hypothetical protein
LHNLYAKQSVLIIHADEENPKLKKDDVKNPGVSEVKNPLLANGAGNVISTQTVCPVIPP